MSPYEGATYPVRKAESDMRESNPRRILGRNACYLYTNVARWLPQVSNLSLKFFRLALIRLS